MSISVVTPAHNEEQYLAECISSVQAAAQEGAIDFEHIVVLNRCRDRTEEIAKAGGCRVVREDARNLSRIRNAGIAVARHDILVTIDADSRMSRGMLAEVIRRLDTGRYIGGGAMVYPERLSLGLFCSLLVVLPYVLWHGVSAGMFWCYKRDCDTIGGFDETLACVEDVDFGKRLKALGRNRSLKYGTICREYLITSCRKFDHFGDWYFVRHPGMVRDLFHAKRKAADMFYYDLGDELRKRS